MSGRVGPPQEKSEIQERGIRVVGSEHKQQTTEKSERVGHPPENQRSALSGRFSKIINEAGDDAYVVLPANGSGKSEEMSPQVIDVEAKPERRREPVLYPTPQRPGRIVNVAFVQRAV